MNEIPTLSDSDEDSHQDLVFYIEVEETDKSEHEDATSPKSCREASPDETKKQDYPIQSSDPIFAESKSKSSLYESSKPCTKISTEQPASAPISRKRKREYTTSNNLTPTKSEDLFLGLKQSISSMVSSVSRLHRQSSSFDSPSAQSLRRPQNFTPPVKELEILNVTSRRRKKRNSIIKNVDHRPKIWRDEREFKRLIKEHTHKNTSSPLVCDSHALRVKRRRVSGVKFSPDMQTKQWTKFGTPVQEPTRILSDLNIKTYSIPSPVSPFVPKYSYLLKDSDSA